MRTSFCLSTIILLFLCACGIPSNNTSIPTAIEEKLKAQEESWNKGDLEGFMSQAYWEDDALMFIGSSGLTFGYAQTLANYKKSYPDDAAMGILTFELLQWRSLGSSHGLLVGAWHLERGENLENLEGHFSLTWERQAQEWVIVADHSS
ncbi:MAG: nuclear transport factor 2 family protein [Crocinitomicaceae bacterium]|nr:nuclear transport factor 2 family protein [Crocinitomicaceae bacterium]